MAGGAKGGGGGGGGRLHELAAPAGDCSEQRGEGGGGGGASHNHPGARFRASLAAEAGGLEEPAWLP